VIADQEDLLATVALGAGHSALVCFLPAYFTIELDGIHHGIHFGRHLLPPRRRQ
jgi:hypothetical protein